MEWCRKWSIVVNGKKRGAMNMRRKGVKKMEEKFYVGEEEIVIVEEYKFLGYVLNEHG